MSVASDHVALFRDLWADRFTDTGTITRTAAKGTFNDVTGVYGTPTTVTVYTGGLLVRPGGSERRAEFGEELTTRGPVEVFCPYTVEAAVGDRVTVTVSADPDLDGEILVIRAVVVDSYDTHRTLICELEIP